MNGDVCVLCFEFLSKPTDRNFINGKSQVFKELNDLPFVVNRASPYICKRCLTVVKKRRGLINKVKEINESLKALYHTKCSDTGLTVKTKQVPVHTSAKKLKFSEDDLVTRQDDKEYSHAEYLSQ